MTTPEPEGYGLTKIGPERCPRTLLPRRSCLGPSCWCRSRLNDHAGTYRTADGLKVVLWQPYQVLADEFAEVAAAAEAEGLCVYLNGQAPWNAGQCVALYFHEAEH